jgi:hypothetical protein
LFVFEIYFSLSQKISAFGCGDRKYPSFYPGESKPENETFSFLPQTPFNPNDHIRKERARRPRKLLPALGLVNDGFSCLSDNGAERRTHSTNHAIGTPNSMPSCQPIWFVVRHPGFIRRILPNERFQR